MVILRLLCGLPGVAQTGEMIYRRPLVGSRSVEQSGRSGLVA
jgi:hypothetical protein